MNKVTDSVAATRTMITALVLAWLVPARRDERGVVSIEYLVLGGAIIFMIGILGTATEVQDAVKNAFVALFSG